VPKGDTELQKGDKLLVVSDNNDELINKVEEMGIENIIKM
jgi:Trk K+ transport system NAD-binding subunit